MCVGGFVKAIRIEIRTLEITCCPQKVKVHTCLILIDQEVFKFCSKFAKLFSPCPIQSDRGERADDLTGMEKRMGLWCVQCLLPAESVLLDRSIYFSHSSSGLLLVRVLTGTGHGAQRFGQTAI